MTAADKDPKPRKDLSDQRADTIGILVIFAAVFAAVVHFLTGG
jgi:hypothetical protein